MTYSKETSCGQYRILLVTSFEQLSSLYTQWRGLLTKVRQATIFVTPEWYDCTIRWFDLTNSIYIVAAYEQTGELVGLVPLVKQRVGPWHVLEPAGRQLYDAFDFLCISNSGVAAALAHGLKTFGGWDLISLPQVGPLSELIRELPTLEREFGAPLIEAHPQVSPIVYLPDSWAAFVRRFHRKQRQWLRHHPQKFLKTFGGELCFRQEPSEIEPALQTLYLQMYQCLEVRGPRPIPALEQNARYVMFVQEVCRKLAEHKQVQIIQLAAQGQVIASLLSFVMTDSVHLYKASFDPYWAKFGPGRILDTLYLYYAIETAHLPSFHFGRGAGWYKFDMGASWSLNRWFLIVKGNRVKQAILRLLASGSRLLWQIHHRRDLHQFSARNRFETVDSA
jgi:CelD/BcsL family acetyltransferase involved in cellulose biosynthesis